MKHFYRKLKFIFLALSCSTQLSTMADFNQLIQSPPSNISSNVWQSALTSYMSQCAGGDCPCVLVIAEGIPGQNTSAQMWIGTFKDGLTSELWSGYASRLANSGQNDENVSMDTNLCKRRNGVATMQGGMACIPGRRCKDPSVYRSIAQQLGLPDDVALTSFYFSTPMQNEMYKFHDFYGCNSPPCPQTLGCLGLERQAMKNLCLSYMGSDGSNGINAPERGGVWLYFHNTGQPSQNSGSLPMAGQGYNRLAEGGLCSNILTTHLSSGESVAGTSNGGSSGSSYSSERPQGKTGSSPMVRLTDSVNQLLQESQERQKAIQEGKQEFEQQEAFTIEACKKTTREACPNAEDSKIGQYCEDQENIAHNGCQFDQEA